jgi:hypothetical protein
MEREAGAGGKGGWRGRLEDGEGGWRMVREAGGW